ncbi:hypothetical protein ABFS82_02G083700 [Erythranthe guttata]|uniref:nuclear pore complex protein NUP98A-like n=1 Tax=Erythranthe guttata TaxID=4155 RepID=UPI00064D7797|nr:PREDICTED: nuclear pore complex protein NUP98A-like [Erythranthe guttata]|eukprot:XP_012859080.1 PREDICTED: nuclear pore complex protein NUP98A-like [Erythranthe guttata]
MVIASSNSVFGAKISPPFGTSSSSFGGFQGNASTFSFGNRIRGSAVQPYSVTKEIDSDGRYGFGKIHSISAMTIYECKSHEELRLEDYESKQGSSFPIQKPENTVRNSNVSPFAPFSKSTGFSSSSTFSPFSFQSPSTGLFSTKPTPLLWSNPSTSSFCFSSNSTFSPFSFQSPSTGHFSTKPTPLLWSNPSTSSFSGGQGTKINGLSSGNQHNQESGFASHYSATMDVSGDFFGANNKIESISAMPMYTDKSHEELRLQHYQLRNKGPNPQAFVTSNNNNSTISSGFSTLSPPLNPPNISPFSSCIPPPAASPLIFSTPSTSLSFWPKNSSQPGQTTEKPGPGSTNISPMSQPLPQVSPSIFSTPATTSVGIWPKAPQLPGQTDGKTGPHFTNNSPMSQPSQASNSSTVLAEVAINQNINAQPQYVPCSSSTVGIQSVSPLGIRYAPIQHGTTSTVQVSQKTPPLSIRHVSSRHSRLPDRGHSRARSTEPNKVPFFRNEENIRPPFPIDPFLPRENPRACFINSHRIFRSTTISDGSPSKSRIGKDCEDKACRSGSFKLNVDEEEEDDAEAYEKLEADVLALMPNLPNGDYYTEPSIKDLAAKEISEPGFCSRVNDFVVGRKGYGSIKFLGETDIRILDIESVICFNNREVLVYPDASKMPPAGKSLNKPAEITLMNVKCISKKTGKEYVDGAEARSYEEMLRKKTSKYGAEFVSFDPVLGEWKFRVQHF